ncbi:4-galactosyl-N-acetylglucosaminide 3-alpha-L-fucosyltransferase FUT6-like [Melitaea cinxia]|uniref:4-galactosyl-N-acetylglucosaminide 3-alpha-L-fucosyltransferase FUT6-like n=1 Tax=Melitaea cinxia TaxID=113334 RepID=UPI001E271236|nr:4-galactosyl-N-acetylglucosaminide 3-alpha-L-fucosyltransferase FUT6-like [Melitaea cinxia]
MKKFEAIYTYLILISLCLLVIYTFNVSFKTSFVSTHFQSKVNIDGSYIKDHNDIVNNYYKSRKDWQTSNLGTFMFKNFSQEIKLTKENDPLSECSVHNCEFTRDDTTISSADAVVIHIQKGILPNVTGRNPKQRWIFLSDESPMHSFSMSKSPPKILDLANIFNWSMTYRSDSDVPVPYGRTIPLQKPILNEMTDEYLTKLIPYWNNKQRDILATILISNCGVSRRMAYLKELQEQMSVEVYGQCSKNHKTSCRGHFRSDCNLIANYLFYLVFENSLCEDYLTEKLFYNAYSKGAIPVIMGPSVDNCKHLLPPNSFLHVDNYKNAQELAEHMLRISKDENNILSYHRWRNDFEVVNEHGYFGSKSYHFCRVCEALNYNDVKEKVYDEKALRIFFDRNFSCRQ